MSQNGILSASLSIAYGIRGLPRLIIFSAKSLDFGQKKLDGRPRHPKRGYSDARRGQ